VHEIDKIDLMLYKVELIKNFMEAWGNEFGGMASSFIRTYDQVVDLIHENDLETISGKDVKQWKLMEQIIFT
jgi:hypothetical protein